jgi:hypothetical protein
MIGSAVDFFFMIAFTIVQKHSVFRAATGNPGDLGDFPSTPSTYLTHEGALRLRNTSNSSGLRVNTL